MLQFTNEKPRMSLRIYNNKQAWSALLCFGPPWWLSVLMPAVIRVTWHDNFRVSLPFVSSDSVTSEELTKEESNQRSLLSLPSEN